MWKLTSSTALTCPADAGQNAAAHREILFQMDDVEQAARIHHCDHSPAKWQRAECPGAISRRRGSSRRQMSWQCRQRGWNLQPGGNCHGLGTMPSIVLSLSALDWPSSGRELEQAVRVGMQRVGEQLGHGGLLDHLRGVHHGHVVGHFGHDAQVVGDQQDRHAHLALQGPQQIQDLGLDGDVEGRGRLVGDQQLRVAGEGHGDHHPLPHAAGELVRIVAEPPLAARGCRTLRSISIGAAARFRAVDLRGAGGWPR